MSESDFIRVFKERGFLHQCTDEESLASLMGEQSIPVYIGFDCTATSLHVGSLIQIMVLRLLQRCGHKPIVLLGAGTTKIGDPSGKDESRQLLDAAAIEKNLEGIESTLRRFLPDTDVPVEFVNNDEWLSGLGYVGFLRDVGRHFSVNRMLSFESVKIRLEREQNLSFLEFNYMLLQAYDFVELNKRYDCRLQIGGSDQWGNIVNGVELGRRLGTKELFGLTTPLITTANGAKMGKTAQGAIWLTESLLPSYDYWQFWRNVDDQDVGRFLRLFTELPIDEVKRLEELQGAEINEAKIVLANEATRICHGQEAAKTAEKTAKQTFEMGVAGESLPTESVSVEELQAGIPVFKAMVTLGLVQSNGEARRLIKGGGARVNDEKVAQDDQCIFEQDLNSEGVIKLSAGKKKHGLLRIA
jgi:tyrosyl-tRNA synthetase